MNADGPYSTEQAASSSEVFSPLYLVGVVAVVVTAFSAVWFLPDVLSKGSDTAAQMGSALGLRSGQSSVDDKRSVTRKISAGQSNAAAKFLTFYWLNARARVEYCRARGVSISRFKRAFESAQSRTYARAVELTVAVGRDEESLYVMAEPMLATLIQTDMNTIAKQAGGESTEGCRLVDDKADFIVGQLDFERGQPELYRAIMGG